MNKARRERIQNVFGDLSEIKRRVEEIQSDEEEAFENTPEGLQDCLRGLFSQNAIDSLSNAVETIDEALNSLSEAMI